MKKTITTLALIALASALQAAVPYAWNVETTRAQPVMIDLYRGESIELKATILNRGAALDVSGSEPQLYWQTNGMGNAYWSAPASATSNVLHAVWSATNDVGAASYNCFIGSSSGSYRAAFRLRMIAAPGHAPNTLAMPPKTLDFSTVTVLNPPYYTTSEIDEILADVAVEESDPIYSADKPGINQAISDLQTESALVYRLYSGSNVVCEVTNYNSVVRSPSMRLLQLTESNEYTVVWTETNGLSRIAASATNYTDKAISEEAARADAAYAPRAWSGVTSGLGAVAPPNTTWISTPSTVIAGGYEFAKTVTSSGALWVLTSNGMAASTNEFGFFDLSAADGTSIFRIEKTDSYLVGADADGITSSGNTVTIPLSVVSADHPYLRYATSLTSPITWYKEEENNLPSGVTYAWSGTSGAWVCTITVAPSATQGFFCFEFLQEGGVKIINNGVTDLTAGIYYNGVKYVPTVSGTELKFIAE